MASSKLYEQVARLVSLRTAWYLLQLLCFFSACGCTCGTIVAWAVVRSRSSAACPYQAPLVFHSYTQEACRDHPGLCGASATSASSAGPTTTIASPTLAAAVPVFTLESNLDPNDPSAAARQPRQRTAAYAADAIYDSGPVAWLAWTPAPGSSVGTQHGTLTITLESPLQGTPAPDAYRHDSAQWQHRHWEAGAPFHVRVDIMRHEDTIVQCKGHRACPSAWPPGARETQGAAFATTAADAETGGWKVIASCIRSATLSSAQPQTESGSLHKDGKAVRTAHRVARVPIPCGQLPSPTGYAHPHGHGDPAIAVRVHVQAPGLLLHSGGIRYSTHGQPGGRQRSGEPEPEKSNLSSPPWRLARAAWWLAWSPVRLSLRLARAVVWDMPVSLTHTAVTASLWPMRVAWNVAWAAARIPLSLAKTMLNLALCFPRTLLYGAAPRVHVPHVAGADADGQAERAEGWYLTGMDAFLYPARTDRRAGSALSAPLRCMPSPWVASQAQDNTGEQQEGYGSYMQVLPASHSMWQRICLQWPLATWAVCTLLLTTVCSFLLLCMLGMTRAWTGFPRAVGVRPPRTVAHADKRLQQAVAATVSLPSRVATRAMASLSSLLPSAANEHPSQATACLSQHRVLPHAPGIESVNTGDRDTYGSSIGKAVEGSTVRSRRQADPPGASGAHSAASLSPHTARALLQRIKELEEE